MGSWMNRADRRSLGRVDDARQAHDAAQSRCRVRNCANPHSYASPYCPGHASSGPALPNDSIACAMCHGPTDEHLQCAVDCWGAR